jgi:hypothetical protein
MSTELVLDLEVPAAEDYEIDDLLDLVGRHRRQPLHYLKRYGCSYAARNSLKAKFIYEFYWPGELAKALHLLMIDASNVIRYMARGGFGSPGWLAYVLCGS